eukprot:TRINITY_DN76359_c0_g1_i1.p1 TRINITY_DN76359_c0_g1~~TRINITY_DN76359_c0_g1_i1.p1  ORF type:complete len:194 (+),score=6.63 TRINITY_DN76359_c0_g1_i1:34-582(+)
MTFPKVSLAEGVLAGKPLQHSWFRGTAQYYISKPTRMLCQRYAIRWDCCGCMAGTRVRMRLAISNAKGKTIPFRSAQVSFPGNVLKVHAFDGAKIDWLLYSERLPERVTLESACLRLDARGLLIYIAKTDTRASWSNLAIRVEKGALKTEPVQEEFATGSDVEVATLEFHRGQSSSTAFEPR